MALESGAELVDIQVLLGYVNLATTQSGQERRQGGDRRGDSLTNASFVMDIAIRKRGDLRMADCLAFAYSGI
jgi:hypothetical protein